MGPASDLPEPHIIPRADHPISRKDIDREALKVLYRLRDAGYVAFLVGGGVRDLYLGKKPKDFDISTNARPGQLKKLFKNSRVIGRRFRLVQVFFHGGKIVEVSTFRCRSEFDIKDEDEVLASNNTFGNPADDAFRRDLTINALFYTVETFSIIDYIGGVADLNDKIIRIVGDADRRIVRDPVRMLRAIRHAARSGFTIEPETWKAICTHRDKLHLCPVSRIRDELFKDLNGSHTRAWTELALASGVFHVIFPFYEGIVATPAEDEPEESPSSLLLKMLGVVDRLHAKGKSLPENILLAALLLPWAIKKFDLFSLSLRGHEAFTFSRSVRQDIDEMLEHLNIKRSNKESITSLLVNLPVFARHDQDKGWPKWLSRKSYFMDGRFFFQMYQEASDGEPVRLALLDKLPKHKVKAKPRKRPSKRGKRGPAFSKNKGGIFGLKKR